MSGHTPGDPVIARSEQLRERLEGMKELAQRFTAGLLAEIQALNEELDLHQEGAGDDDTHGT